MFTQWVIVGCEGIEGLHSTQHLLASLIGQRGDAGCEQGAQWADDGILSNTLNPGAIATGLQKHTGGLKTPVERRKTAEQGAATSVLLALSPLLDGVSGRYFEDCNEAEQVFTRPTDFSGGYAAYALDADNATRLWAISHRFIEIAR
jgi:hypothetical protein